VERRWKGRGGVVEVVLEGEEEVEEGED